jgi:hypothetical protein
MTRIHLQFLKMNATSAQTAFQMARARTDFNDSEELRAKMAHLAYSAMQKRIALTNACLATCPLLGGEGFTG